MATKKSLDLEMRISSLLSFVITAVVLSVLQSCAPKERKSPTELFQLSPDIKTRWSSPENRNGEVGVGGKENNGGKGHAFDSIAAGATIDLLNVEGTGRINRMWITIIDRSPEMLRSLKLEMFWDGSTKPAVSVPFGDFFGVGLGRTTAFQNSLFANAEGRAFQCFIPMPFKQGARVSVTNESAKKLSHIFFDIDFQLENAWSDDNLYFHSYWSRDTATALARDFELLPAVHGKGRFLGVNVGVTAKSVYKTSWWGEGEVKIYLDDDTEWATLVGTGTEDYIGTGWGQGAFINNFAGCSVADPPNRQWCFYRFHVPDPVFFSTSCKVALQQIGGDMKTSVLEMQRAGAPLIPVTIDSGGKLTPLYQKDSVTDLSRANLPDGWTNFYRSDDLSATAYFYLDAPVNDLPEIQTVAYRSAKLSAK